jgi:hypothetical protein
MRAVETHDSNSTGLKHRATMNRPKFAAESHALTDPTPSSEMKLLTEGERSWGPTGCDLFLPPIRG